MPEATPPPTHISIVGTGHVVPETKLTSRDIDARNGWQAGHLEALCGVKSRFLCTKEDQIDMAVAASQRALNAAGLTPGDIDLVLGACAIGYQPLPATAPLVMQRLGMADGDAFGMDINSTCLSFLSALDHAAAKITLGQAQRVLIVSSEVASRALPWADHPEVAGLFGDGAGAAVVTTSTQGAAIRAQLFQTAPSAYEACQIGAGGTRFDFHADAADFAAHAQFRMDGKRLFRVTHAQFPAFFERLLTRAGWRLEDVGLVIPHQASPLALRHMVERTALRAEQVVDIAARYGNQIAASLPTALDIALRGGRIGPGCKVVMVGTSAGVSFGGMALEF